MSNLVPALKSFRNGSLSQEELFVELDHILEDDRTDGAWLLQLLDEEHARAPLPEEVREKLRVRIDRSAQVKRRQEDGNPADIARRPGLEDATRLQTRLHDTETVVSVKTREKETESVERPSAGASTELRHIVGVGDVLNDRFELIERLGTGGMSAVYKALDRRKLEADDRNPYVAVKVLNLEFRAHPKSLIALQREAKKSQMLAHPNIVRVYDFDRDGATVYMTMEFLSGRSLSQIIKDPDFNGMPEDEALRILDGMAEALRYAHENGILHADFKPANVFLTDSGKVKVIDFGIARAFHQPGQTEDEKTRFDPGLLGAMTPTHASPEMLEQQEMDPRDDIFALACTAYELLTGVHPFGRIPANQARDGGLQVRRHKSLTQRQWKALRSALEFDRDQRTPTVAQFCEAMRPGRVAFPVSAAMGLAAAVLVMVAVAGIFYLKPTMQEIPVATLPGIAAPERTVDSTRKQEDVALVEPALEKELTEADRLVPGETFRDCPWCPQMVVVPAGSFMQGSPEPEQGRLNSEGPRHRVTIDYPLAIGLTEVTVRDFGKFVADTGYEQSGCWVYRDEWTKLAGADWKDPGFQQDKTHPVSCISWEDAQAYVRWLSKSTNKDYRLPSASEWEYITRARSEQSRPWGESPASACLAANVADVSAEQQYAGWNVHPCDDGYVHTAPVKSFKPNEFGVYDALGNVFEWVEDCWNDNYRKAPADGTAWKEGECRKRVLRGGSWFSQPDFVRSAFRNRFDDDFRSSSFGFRVARGIE